jgi:methylated-DNA-[protein]-cysteine S-methyltransferase
MHSIYISSPVGPLEIRGSDSGIHAIQFISDQVASMIGTNNTPSSVPAALGKCAEQLTEYFSGTRTTFDLPLAPEGTVFQKCVWQELQHIAFGETLSYLALAERLGDAKAVRAAGGANGKNPIAIVIPCHRVIGASGKLVGYSGGMENKVWLLRHEQHFAKRDDMLF